MQRTRRGSLGEVGPNGFGLGTKGGNVDVAHLLFRLCTLPIAPVDRQAKGRHRGTGWRIPHVRIPGQIAEQSDSIEACHTLSPSG